jgi:hypothetical protein
VTIEQLGSLGEVVGAIATIGTLWYLALQIRQSSKTERASNFVQIMQDQNVWLSITQSGEVADIYMRGLRDFKGLTEIEQTRFHMVLSLHFSNMQLAFRLHQEGALATELYQDTFASMLNFVENPGARDWWQSAQQWFHPEFVEHVNSEIRGAAA